LRVMIFLSAPNGRVQMIPEGYREYFEDQTVFFGSVWIELGEYLADRLQWRWEMQSSEADRADFEDGFWCYGLTGTCVLALTVSTEGQFVLYIPRGATEERYFALDDLGLRLAELEREYEDLSPLQMDLTDELLSDLLQEWRRDQGIDQ
jgi:hypothetical protein